MKDLLPWRFSTCDDCYHLIWCNTISVRKGCKYFLCDSKTNSSRRIRLRSMNPSVSSSRSTVFCNMHAFLNADQSTLFVPCFSFQILHCWILIWFNIFIKHLCRRFSWFSSAAVENTVKSDILICFSLYLSLSPNFLCPVSCHPCNRSRNEISKGLRKSSAVSARFLFCFRNSSFSVDVVPTHSLSVFRFFPFFDFSLAQLLNISCN